jgi:hypothetical protein
MLLVADAKVRWPAVLTALEVTTLCAVFSSQS